MNQGSDDSGVEGSFTLVVSCDTRDGPHSHQVTIGHDWGVAGVAPPANVRLQYTCKLSGKAKMMTFKPPREAAWPFKILHVSNGE